MVEEERSRFEKWWESETVEFVSMVAKSYARDAWMARAALEDRQEAAPERRPPFCNYAIVPVASGGFLHCNDSSGHGGEHSWRGPWTVYENYGGVPSEATPSKENAPPECPEREIPRAKDSRLRGKKYLYPEAAPTKCEHDPEDRDSIGCAWCDSKNAAPAPEVPIAPTKGNAPPEWPTLPAPDPFDAGFQAGLELGKFQTPKPLLLCNLCGMRRDEHIDTDHRFLDGRTAPAPEAQGTPAKECICPTETWTVDGSDMHDSMCEIDHDSPVGTPQKETPPDFTCEECDSHCCITAGGSKLICYHCHLAKVERAIGESAGRRSAITELKEWIENDEDTISFDKGVCAALDVIVAKCAELQEKTK